MDIKKNPKCDYNFIGAKTKHQHNRKSLRALSGSFDLFLLEACRPLCLAELIQMGELQDGSARNKIEL